MIVHGDLAIAADLAVHASGRVSKALPDQAIMGANLGTLDLAVGPVPISIAASIALKV